MYKLTSENLVGEVKIPYSKSTSHRSIIIGILNRGITKIYNLNYCDDVIATLEIAKQIGCVIKINNNCLIMDSTNLNYTNEILDCRESGTTYRFMALILLFLFKEVRLTGTKKLLSRPFDGYKELFSKNSIEYIKQDDMVIIKGELRNIEVLLNNEKSSQFVSAILLISPFFASTKLTLLSSENSVGYVDLTIAMMQEFGIKIIREKKEISIKKGQYKLVQYYNEVDESAYPYFYTLQALGQNITIVNNNQKTFQPDYIFKTIKDETVIDINNCPDILPILVVYKILAQQKGKFVNIQRARYKESNRVEEMLNQLIDSGFEIIINDNVIEIGTNHKVSQLHLSSVNDHRLAMSFIILSTVVGTLYLDDIKCIDKSYPTFINDFISLGGKIEKYEKNFIL